MSKVKICGLRSAADIEAVNQYHSDYAGMILTKKFWRYVDRETASLLKKALDPSIKMAGVFVNEDIDYVASFLKDQIIDIAQLHGDEDDAYIDALHDEVPGCVIIKAFQVKSESDIQAARQSHADFVLLDGGTGNGRTFDWKLINDVGREYFLAGGLNPDNVRKAVKYYHPFAVDTSSGVETDRKKDKKKIAAFIQNVRRINDEGEL